MGLLEGQELEVFLKNISDRQNEENREAAVRLEVKKNLARKEAVRLAHVLAGADAEVRRIYLFGSCLASRGFEENSDIDLALEGGDLLALLPLVEGSPFPVDLVDLKDLRPFFRNRVLSEGEVLFEKNEG